MMDFKKIVFPTDFSQLSTRALSCVLGFGKKYGASISMLYVRDPLENSSRLEHQFQWLVNQAPAITAAQIQVSISTEENHNVAGGILDFLRDRESSLVVMGTHGDQEVPPSFIGSVTEKVLRHARCPVLVTGPGTENHRGVRDFKSIIAPVDFSKHSRLSVRAAANIAQQFGARLKVMHIVEQPAVPPYLRPWASLEQDQVDQIIRVGKQALVDLLDEEGVRNSDMLVRTAQDGASGISAEALKSTQEDLIVIGDRGLSIAPHGVLGKTAESIVRSACSPVLVYKLPPQ
jgi:nucleotide-binding universal stress UspA family protein